MFDLLPSQVSDTKAEGSGASVMAGRCCTVCFHNKGDAMELKDGKWTFSAGASPNYPPCIQNSEVGYMTPVEAKGGAPPSAAEMAR